MNVAQAIINTSFKGLYADVNAISPQRSVQIGALMTQAGIEYVDGGIVGGPAWEPDSTWLYLSGGASSDVAALFSKGPLETEIIDQVIGKASALKMSFAAYTKGSTALLCAIVAAAEKMGVRDILEKQWSRNGSPFAEQTRNRISRVTAKAWRFSGEMAEIADTLEAAGLPDGFHRAAQEVYHRMDGFKDAPEFPAVEEVLQALLNPKQA
jgi:3-hydroxyisobutyrate dehydrogenase-like beta-hydroxyacid dehydrogenase